MDTLISPIYLLRDYTWALLKENTSMTEAGYGNKVPIVPLGEEPELDQYSGPHLVYGYAMSPSNDLFAQQNGSMTFAVYSQKFSTLTEILTILQIAFGRWDESADDVNAFTSRKANFVGIRFGSINVGYVEGGSPEDTEGGRMSGLINIRFSYFVDYDVKTQI